MDYFAMKYVLSVERIFESEGSDYELLGVYDLPEDALRAFVWWTGEWQYYRDPQTKTTHYSALVYNRRHIQIYAYVTAVEENAEQVSAFEFIKYFEEKEEEPLASWLKELR